MQAALKLTTRVLPGRRIEFTAPELTEGEDVEIVVALPQTAERSNSRIFASAAEYLDSLPPIPRTTEEWTAIERELNAEKDSWDR